MAVINNIQLSLLLMLLMLLLAMLSPIDIIIAAAAVAAAIVADTDWYTAAVAIIEHKSFALKFELFPQSNPYFN